SRPAPGPVPADIAIMAVERTAAGVTFAEPYRTNCAHFLPIGEMELEATPADLVVPPGAGMRAALGAIDVARCDIAAIACGLHAESIDVALAATRGRHAFGQRVLDFQGVQWQLADLATDLEASRLPVPRGAPRARGPLPTRSLSRPTPPCARRSPAASCSAPTAGSTTIRWRASSRWPRCCRSSTAPPRSNGWSSPGIWSEGPSGRSSAG